MKMKEKPGEIVRKKITRHFSWQDYVHRSKETHEEFCKKVQENEKKAMKTWAQSLFHWVR